MNWDKLESFFKIATPIGAIIAFLMGIYHYRDSKSEEFKKEYWEKRYYVYEHVCELSSLIANPGSQTEMDSLKRQFWIAYTGKAMLVEDLHVFNALKSFGQSLDKAVYPDSLTTLITKAHLISKACRISLKETWEPVNVTEIETLDK